MPVRRCTRVELSLIGRRPRRAPATAATTMTRPCGPGSHFRLTAGEEIRPPADLSAPVAAPAELSSPAAEPAELRVSTTGTGGANGGVHEEVVVLPGIVGRYNRRSVVPEGQHRPGDHSGPQPQGHGDQDPVKGHP